MPFACRDSCSISFRPSRHVGPIRSVEGLGEPGIDVGRHLRRARARRVLVGRNDHLGELVDQRQLLAREEGRRSGLRGQRFGLLNRHGDRRGGAERDRLPPGEFVAHRFPFLNSDTR